MEYITNTDSTILPYNDDDMKYSLSLRQYVLTQTGFKNLTGINASGDFDSPTEFDNFLIECSDDIYDFIDNTSSSSGLRYKRYTIAKNENLREKFKRVLSDQSRYAYRSGAHLIKDQHGINIEKGKKININDLRNQVGISKSAISKLNHMGLIFAGFLICSQFEDDGTW